MRSPQKGQEDGFPTGGRGRASGASEAGALGATKEVLGLIIDFLAFNLDFPRISYSFIRIS